MPTVAYLTLLLGKVSNTEWPYPTLRVIVPQQQLNSKLFKITSLWDVRERRKGSTNCCLPLMVDPIFPLCCLLLAPCSFTDPATQRSCKSTRKGNYKKHTSIIDSRIRINQIYKHQYATETHAYRRTSNALLMEEVKFRKWYNHKRPNPASPPSRKKSPLHLLQANHPIVLYSNQQHFLTITRFQPP